MTAAFVQTLEERIVNIFDGILVEDLVGAEPKIVKMLVKAGYLTIVETEDGEQVSRA